MKFFGNVNKLEADIDATAKVLQPVLEKAGITSAMRDGKVIPIADATNAEKFAALMSAQPIGTNLEERSSLLQSNDIISKRCEKAESDLAIAQTSVGNLTREKATLENQFNTSQASVTSLTNEKADLSNRLNASTSQCISLTNQLRDQKQVIAKKCLAAGCLDLKGVAEDATEEVKLTTAMSVTDGKEAFSFNDLVASYSGAVNASMAKTGLSFDRLPAGAPNGQAAKPQLTGRARMSAATKIVGN